MAPRVWFITGCSTGFGKEISLQALSRGDKVIATARNPSRLTTLKEAGADIIDFDVTSDLAVIEKKIQAAHHTYGRLDILVNNAGFLQEGALEELRYDFVHPLAMFVENWLTGTIIEVPKK